MKILSSVDLLMVFQTHETFIQLWNTKFVFNETWQISVSPLKFHFTKTLNLQKCMKRHCKKSIWIEQFQVFWRDMITLSDEKNIYSDIMTDQCQRTYIEHMKYDNQRIIVEFKKIKVDLNHLVQMDFVYNVFTNFFKCHTLNTGIESLQVLLKISLFVCWRWKCLLGLEQLEGE